MRYSTRNGRPAAAGCEEAPSLAAISALLNTAAADRVFRCMSGSVAVSAYELAAVPLPGPAEMLAFATLVARGAPREERERREVVGFRTSVIYQHTHNQVLEPLTP